jgi:FkbM family methyltransferase
MYIIDIGANRGLFTDKCLETYGSSSKIVLVDANPNLFNHLKFKYSQLENITILNALVSDKSDLVIDFYLNDADVISTASIDWVNNSRFNGKFFWREPIGVLSISLDRLIEIYGKPNLIKVDVEGYEFEVLKGLNTKIEEICFEWAEEQYENINKTIDHLKTIGYSQFGYIFGDEYLKRPEIYTSWEESEFHNDIDTNRKELWGMIWAK